MGYLVADGVNDYCTIPNALTGNAGTDPYTVEFNAAFPAAPAADRFLIGVGSGTSNNGFQITTGGRLQVWAGGTNRYFTATGFIIFDSTFRTYRLEHDAGGAWRAYRNGALFGSGTFSTSAAFTALGLFFRIHPTSSGYLGGNFSYITTTGLGNSDSWQADLSGGTGSVWPTTSGTNNATLINFPTDNSQWQGFSSGTAYADTLQAGAYTSAGSQLTSVVAYSSALQTGSYVYSGSALSSAVSYSSALQSGAFSYSGSELQSIISNGAQNYTDTLLGGSFTHSGSALQSAIARSSALLAGSYSHSGSNLTASLAFYSSLNGGAYSHFGGVLQSTVSGEVTVSIEGYTITFAADDVSGAFAADIVAATFINDYVSATWSN